MSHEKERKAAIEVICTIRDAIKEAKELPSGMMYSIVMQFMSLESYTKIIQTLKDAKLVSEQNHVLRWVGPS